MARKVIAYHVWGKTWSGKEVQADVYRQPTIGKYTKIGNTVCKVTDYARYEMADRRAH